MSVSIDLKGRSALITGGSGGLGRAIALRLAEAGAAVAVSDLAGDRLDAAEAEVRGLGGEATALAADLTDDAQARRLVDQAVERFGRLDVLVNCAGIMQTKPLLDLTPQEWRRMIDVDLNATFFVTQAAGAAMLAAGGGSIVTLASVAARSGRPLAAHYSAAKTGLLSLTKSAAAALAPMVRVNAVCPGLFLTPMWDGIVADRAALLGEEAGHRYREEVRSACLLQRPGAPTELADVVLFLCSDLAAYVTGQALNVDGGLEMH